MRVAKAHGASCTSSPPIDVLYWRSVSGGTIAETDSSGSTTNAAYHEYIFFGGRRIARSDVSGSIYFLFADHLGSTRSMTQANGTVCFTSEYRPDGLELNTTSSCSTNYKFTGYERDPETGIDYAFARFYNPRLARFMSGDPLGGDASDPQSHNRYTYVRNNSTNFTDPSGACPAEYQDCGTFDWYHGDGSGQHGRGSTPSQLWGAAYTQYLQQVYNSGTRIGPDGNRYRFDHDYEECVSVSGGPQECSVHSVWFRVVNYTFDDFLKQASDFSAGAGDVLSFGTTYLARKYIFDSDKVVDKGSGAYITGAVTGTAISTAIGATGGAVAGGKYGAIFGRGDPGQGIARGIVNRGPVRFGWAWEGSATTGRNVIRLGIGAARGTSWLSHIPFFYP